MNLGRKTSTELQSLYGKKMWAMMMLFLVFLFERRLVAISFADSFAFYPILSMSICLMLVLTIVKLTGSKGPYLLGILCFVFSLLPYSQMNRSFAYFVHKNLIFQFEYDSPITEFMGATFIGYLLGHIYFNNLDGKTRYNPKIWLGIPIVIALLIPFLFLGSMPEIQKQNFEVFENVLAQEWHGLWLIWSICLGLGLITLAIKNAFNEKWFYPVIWVGKNSIFVFFFHQIIFLYFWAPSTDYIVNVLDLEFKQTFPIVCSYAGATCIVCYLFHRSKIFNLLRS